jgi:hypothetical protein
MILMLINYASDVNFTAGLTVEPEFTMAGDKYTVASKTRPRNRMLRPALPERGYRVGEVFAVAGLCEAGGAAEETVFER